MSRTVTVVRRLKASPAEVFATISDSDRLARVPGVKLEILRPGTEHRDGVGLQRKVGFPGGYIVEEVVGLQQERAFDYVIRDASVSFRHEWGRIGFEPDGTGTRVTWTSTFAVPAGPLTVLTEQLGVTASRVGFTLVLRSIDRHLARR